MINTCIMIFTSLIICMNTRVIFSYQLGFKKWTQAPAGSLYFNNVVATINDKSLTTTELTLSITLCAYMNNFTRVKFTVYLFINKYPILSLIILRVKKRFLVAHITTETYISRLINVYTCRFLAYWMFYRSWKNIWPGTFPVVNHFPANQTYAYDIDSYNLMNFLEFVSDQYEHSDLDQHFMGFFFNKIPLLKNLKWREVVSFKAIYGGLK
jgi:hypothetical protein